MKTTSRCMILIGMIVLPLLLTGCQQPTPAPTPAPTAQPYEMPLGPGTVWQLVIISDSSLWGVGEAFADQIEQDLGITVEYIDYALGGSGARDVLDALQTGKSPILKLEKLPAILKDAEVVIVFLNYWKSIDPEKPLDMDQCFGSAPPVNCDPERFAQWTADLNAIWGEVIKLREGQPTILRAVDLYNPLVQPWTENGVFEACTRCWENMSDAARLAAEPYNIPFLSRLDAMNGINHDEDPRVKGFILDDGEHPSELGAQYMAQLLAEMGYEPVTPP